MRKVFFALLLVAGCGEYEEIKPYKQNISCNKNYENVVPQNVKNIIGCSGYNNFVKDTIDSVIFYEYKEQCYWVEGESIGCVKNDDKCKNVYILKHNNETTPTNYMLASIIIHETVHIMGFGEKEAYNTAYNLFYKNYIKNNCQKYDNN